MLKYDVSIIVAIYNNDKYLEKCIKSVIKQDYDFERIQLILINDGSTDNSIKICNKYAKKYNNILLIDKKNEGVSRARNIGIKKAKGKYIMILDSDDEISNNAVKELVSFFDNNYDRIDLVTYPMVNITKKSKNVHFRYGFFDKGTGIYDLEEYPYICQSNVNIIFKNKFNDNILYNTNMFFSEDEEFNTRILLEKLKIGYCSKAKYYYNKTNELSAIKNKSNPYYCFESLMEYHEYLINFFESKGKNVPKYVQAVILNDFRWRVKTDEIFPYFLPNIEFNKEVARIKNILKKVDNDIIINNKKINIYHKIFFLKFKGENLYLKFIDNKKYQICCNNQVCLTAERITIVINRYKVKENKVNILAYIRTPIFEINNYKPELYLRYIDKENNKKDKKIEKFFVSNKSYFCSKIKTNHFFGFELNLNLNEIKRFKFVFKLMGQEINAKVECSVYTPFNEMLGRYMVEKGNKIIRFNPKNKGKYQFYIRERNLKNSIALKLINLKRYIMNNKKIKILRCFAKTNKKIWIYTDRKGILDNAYYQFKHDINIKDNIRKYYVYDGKKRQYKKAFTKKERKYLVKYNSLIHKILFLKSSKILTSFSSLYEYCPVSKFYKYYRDVMKYDLIYLQHGILHADLLKMYSKEFTEIDKIVVSSEFEKRNFIEKYKYNDEDIIMSGMPRLQNSKKEVDVKNKILLAPSWRKYLIGEIYKGERELKEKVFLKSNYFTEMSRFINSKELINLLKTQNLELDLQLHPIFRDYANLFKTNSKRVSIVERTNIEEYKLLITDFSSFQFDFVKLKRPIIYFVPDMPEFKAGLHSYRKLDLDYENAFGKLTLNTKDLMETIKKIIKNNFKDEEKYIQREKEFFVDTNNTQEKLYNELIKGDQKVDAKSFKTDNKRSY